MIYHHRTRCNGAEGVHIRGIKNALRSLGADIIDVSLVDCDGKIIDDESVQKRKTVKQYFFSFIADVLPNIFFKIIELIYSIYAIGRGYKSIQLQIRKEKGKEIDFIYDRYAYFSFAMPFLARYFSIPLVLEVNTTCLDYDVREIKFRSLASKVEKYCFFNANTIVVVSNYLKNKIINEYSIDSNKLLVTPNAVDPDIFLLTGNAAAQSMYENVERFSAGKVIIGFVGIFVPWHGLKLLIDAFAALSDECKEIGLVLVGDGPIRSEIEEIIKNKGLTEKVIITGKVCHDDVKYFINNFDIAVMPDSNPFGSPMKIFEYMVLGKAVLVPSYSPILEIVKHNENGLVFEKQNLDIFTTCLLQLVKDEGLRSRLGENARKLIFAQHTWVHNVEKIIKSIQSSAK